MKTVEEWSNAFDVLLANYLQEGYSTDLGQDSSLLSFDEYEKSIFLTNAQEEIILSLYNNTSINGNADNVERNKRVLDSLISVYEKSSYIQEPGLPSLPEISPLKALNPQSISNSRFTETEFTINEDCMAILREYLTFSNTDKCTPSHISVTPVSYDELNKVLNNPFKCPNSRKAIRIDVGNKKVKVISTFSTYTYNATYLKKPEPIILCLLEGDLSIDGKTSPQTCLLSEIIHQEILNRAVQNAVSTRIKK